MLHSTHVSSSRTSSRSRASMFFAWLALQLASSGCSKDKPHDPAPPAVMVDDSDVDAAANGGGSDNVDAGKLSTGSERDASTQADMDAGGRDESVGNAGSSGETESGDDGKKPGGAVDFDMTKFSRSLAAAVCKSLLDCLGEQKLRAFMADEDCETRFAGTYAQGDFGTLNDSVSRGRIELHADSLEKCYADTRERGCSIQTKRLPSSCQAALRGTVALGDTCTSGADCAGQAFCPASACQRVCSARRAAAESCKRDEECQSGLICTQDKCAAPAAIGDACAGDSGGVCGLGTSCVGSTTDMAGKCQANKDVQVGELDAVCTPGGSLCKEGLSCAYDGDKGFSCHAPVKSGATCHLALPTQCPVDEYCTAKDVTSEGTCSALPKDGEACVLGSECAGGHVCMKVGESDAVCKRVRDLAEECDADAMCRSGRCAKGKCAAAEVCE